jgi:hypothetical protein
LFLGSALWRYYSAALCKEYKFYHDFDFWGKKKKDRQNRAK